jgi:hypothetical protein
MLPLVFVGLVVEVWVQEYIDEGQKGLNVRIFVQVCLRYTLGLVLQEEGNL